jgi:hypothetical protein
MEKTKRRDKDGHVLRTREYQRPDGRYSYHYTDSFGKRRSIYGKTLKELRQKEVKIQEELENGMQPGMADRITLNDLYDKYIHQKYDLKPSTKAVYQYMFDRFVRPDFGKRAIGKIRYSDVRNFYYALLLEKDLHVNTLDSIHAQLHPAFTMAVRDGILLQNPCIFLRSKNFMFFWNNVFNVKHHKICVFHQFIKFCIIFFITWTICDSRCINTCVNIFFFCCFEQFQ